eukprot:Amastigsp_a511734_8.p6 type:complete len:128 gc:universal Amastigsp_a511734_8:913-1296(+)
MGRPAAVLSHLKNFESLRTKFHAENPSVLNLAAEIASQRAVGSCAQSTGATALIASTSVAMTAESRAVVFPAAAELLHVSVTITHRRRKASPGSIAVAAARAASAHSSARRVVHEPTGAISRGAAAS